MKLFVRNSTSGEFYAGTGCWTADAAFALPFASTEAALAQFPSDFHMLELVVQSEVTSSMVALPLLALRMPAAAPRVLESRFLE